MTTPKTRDQLFDRECSSAVEYAHYKWMESHWALKGLMLSLQGHDAKTNRKLHCACPQGVPFEPLEALFTLQPWPSVTPGAARELADDELVDLFDDQGARQFVSGADVGDGACDLGPAFVIGPTGTVSFVSAHRLFACQPGTWVLRPRQTTNPLWAWGLLTALLEQERLSAEHSDTDFVVTGELLSRLTFPVVPSSLQELFLDNITMILQSINVRDFCMNHWRTLLHTELVNCVGALFYAVSEGKVPLVTLWDFNTQPQHLIPGTENYSYPDCHIPYVETWFEMVKMGMEEAVTIALGRTNLNESGHREELPEDSRKWYIPQAPLEMQERLVMAELQLERASRLEEQNAPLASVDVISEGFCQLLNLLQSKAALGAAAQ